MPLLRPGFRDLGGSGNAERFQGMQILRGKRDRKSPFPLPSGEESPAARVYLLRPGGAMRKTSLFFWGRLPERVKRGHGNFASEGTIREAERYGDRERKPFLRHPIKPRIQETCEFAHRTGYQKLGIAFCAGPHKEGAALTQVQGTQGNTHGFKFGPIYVPCSDPQASIQICHRLYFSFPYGISAPSLWKIWEWILELS